MLLKISFTGCFALLALNISVSQQILLDESFNDWNNQVYSYMDKSGDAQSGRIDITDVKMSNDEQFLFIYLNLNKEINLQENNNLTLFIDIDNNVSTGIQKYGLGADLVYNLGNRNGRFYNSAFSSTAIYHNDISLVSSPTVTSDKFELSILRKFRHFFGQSILTEKIKVTISDEDQSGDKAPDSENGYVYSFNNTISYAPASFSISKEKAEYVRVMSYNVLKDKLFDNAVKDNYNRIFKAINPDIIGLCEIYNNSSAQTAALIEEFLPSTNNQKWYHESVNPDIRIISRYPIINFRSLNGNGAFLIDLGQSKLVYIVAHLPCCDNEVQRQQEVDNIMAFIRNVRFGISPFQVPQNTPIIISGDMNLVGLKQQQQTFITGNIADNINYGPDFMPDWDESNLDDAVPLTTNLPLTFTWNSEFGTYSAGRLDYMFYTGSVLQKKNSYSLWTPALKAEQLGISGLQYNDVQMASDHMPLVCDFKLADNTSNSVQYSGTLPFSYHIQNNLLSFKSQEGGQILISDLSGKELIKCHKSADEEMLEIDISSLVSNAIFVMHFYTGLKHYGVKVWK